MNVQALFPVSALPFSFGGGASILPFDETINQGILPSLGQKWATLHTASATLERGFLPLPAT